MNKRTPLYPIHVSQNAKLIPFGGWEMPVQYSGIAEEHLACRNAAGIFDVSHMGEIRIHGRGAAPFLNKIITNDLSKIKDNQAVYTVMCNENGGCVDDLIVHRIHSDDFLLCVNASNADKDFEWITSQKPEGLHVDNVSAEYAQIAIQGPQAQHILSQLTSVDLPSIQYYWFIQGIVLGKPMLIARTGYTGEDGFELYLCPSDAPALWNTLLEAGKPRGLMPCGLGARDTLRIEMKYPLYGHEISEELNPIHAGLGWVVHWDKTTFIGKDRLEQIKSSSQQKKLIGLKCLGKQIPRQSYEIQKNGEKIGFITSGTLSPCLNHGIGIGYIETVHSTIGSVIDVCIRGQNVPHEIVKTPFYKPLRRPL